jgi:hypothetical protein
MPLHKVFPPLSQTSNQGVCRATALRAIIAKIVQNLFSRQVSERVSSIIFRDRKRTSLKKSIRAEARAPDERPDAAAAAAVVVEMICLRVRGSSLRSCMPVTRDEGV